MIEDRDRGVPVRDWRLNLVLFFALLMWCGAVGVVVWWLTH
jgi:hypothetical protein